MNAFVPIRLVGILSVYSGRGRGTRRTKNSSHESTCAKSDCSVRFEMRNGVERKSFPVPAQGVAGITGNICVSEVESPGE